VTAPPLTRLADGYRKTTTVSVRQAIIEELGATVVALTLAGVLVAFVHPAPDYTADAYRVAIFERWGLELWTTRWYDGLYSFLNYSVLYSPLAACIGIRWLAVVSIGGGTFLGARLLRQEWDDQATPSIAALAITWPLIALSSEYPFILGAAFAAAALLAFRRNMKAVFLLAALCALTTSALAFLGLVAAVLALVARRHPSWRQHLSLVAIATGVGAFGLLSMRAFSSSGMYPFPLSNFVQVFGFGVGTLLLSWNVPALRVVRNGSVVLLLFSLVAFVVPSPIGANVSRVRFVSVVIVVLIATIRHWRPRWLCGVVLAASILWVGWPALGNFTRPFNEASSSFWQPAVDFLHDHLGPGYRVEVVDSVDHWGAYYLPIAGVPIVRGWLRQADFPTNAILYQSAPLQRKAYLDWLKLQGVEYVVLPKAPLDASAVHEARLIAGGGSGLTPVLFAPHETVFKVPTPSRIVTGRFPSYVQTTGQEAMTIRLTSPGTYRIAERWSPYWHPSIGCVTRTADGMMAIHVSESGTVRLAMHFDAYALFEAIANPDRPSANSCAAS
jgi:hypothetical protein